MNSPASFALFWRWARASYAQKRDCWLLVSVRCGSAIVSTVMNQILAPFVSSAEPSHFARQNENLANLQCGRFYCVRHRHILNGEQRVQKR